HGSLALEYSASRRPAACSRRAGESHVAERPLCRSGVAGSAGPPGGGDPEAAGEVPGGLRALLPGEQAAGRGGAAAETEGGHGFEPPGPCSEAVARTPGATRRNAVRSAGRRRVDAAGRDRGGTDGRV